MCKKGVGNNSIFCHHCKSWIHYRYSNIKVRLRPDPNFKFQKCCQEREITPALQLKHVNIGNNKLEVIRLFSVTYEMLPENRVVATVQLPHVSDLPGKSFMN